MRILFTLTYYRPHVSGLTIYVERLARALVARGHEVTILTSQHAAELTREELVDGVRIVRAPVAFTVSKGPVMACVPIRARSAWMVRRKSSPGRPTRVSEPGRTVPPGMTRCRPDTPARI